MSFDLRKPLGAMFTLLGLLLVVYGVISRPEIYQRSFSLNVNLIWGTVLLVFGASMLWLGRHRTAS
jgi:multisubunit Na+/H+ antiporter MnhG subunit